MIRAVAFDFDGVVLESADLKTRAFARLYEQHPEHVDAIVALHLRHAGVSRYEKFRWIGRDILGTPVSDDDLVSLNERFSALVMDEILRCPFVPGAREMLLGRGAQIPLYVASGTPEDELRDIVARRELSAAFRGVYGSPAVKAEILERIMGELHIGPEEVLFVGDAMTDLEGAHAAGTPFLGRIRPGDAYPFGDWQVDVVPDMAEMDRRWEALLADPPSIPQ